MCKLWVCVVCALIQALILIRASAFWQMVGDPRPASSTNHSATISTPGPPADPGNALADHGIAPDQPGSVGAQPWRVQCMPGPGPAAMGGPLEVFYPDFIFFKTKTPQTKRAIMCTIWVCIVYA